MTTLSIVIRLSGLLLLSPDSFSTSNGKYYLPLHVLMPQTPGIAQIAHHIPEIVFSSTSQECPTKLDSSMELDQYWRTNYCHVKIDGWSVDIGTPATPTLFTEWVPQANISRFFNARLDRDLFSKEVPGTAGGKLASRVNIYGGAQSDDCLFGWFTIGFFSPIPLVHVVEWTTSVQGTTFPLVRRRVNAAGMPQAETLTTLRAGKSTVYVRNAPESTYLSELPAGIAAKTARGQRDSTMAPTHSATVTVDHYRAFYHLLGIDGSPVPKLYVPANEQCPWDLAVSRKALFKDDPGTQTCMVAVGLPRP